ncbi:glycoside hydrolase family 5 protein [Aliagarivorans taiwanensis]|uniref:glycoside hydrolase family 5 protein n=1 Tax=Aliagarivorans taiwanensis TaxID=561966 RepID=UPI000406401F|nr:cellulase family glycosylhydrolase [Aliagarivorans taiwanensis]
MRLIWQGLFGLSAVLLVSACGSSGGALEQPDQSLPPLDVPVYRAFDEYDHSQRLRVDGAKIVDGAGQEHTLRGVAFGNEIWSNPNAPTQHHDERDYVRLKEMGLNSIRFYLNYQLFERDSQPYVYRQAGWDWLDKNLEWAEKHGIYLVLNMHAPQGGYQSNGAGDALWEVRSNQQRLTRLWQAIAMRYRGHPNIAAFDLLNEPRPTRSNSQWQQLANEIVAAIREVNPEHIVSVERILGTQISWEVDEQQNFFRLDDLNILYQYHFYEPMALTHQQADWLDGYSAAREYPDPYRYEIVGNSRWIGGTFGNPTLAQDHSEWQQMEGEIWWANDLEVEVLYPVLAAKAVSGYVEFADAVVLEYAPGSSRGNVLMEVDLSNQENWYFWSQNGSGSGRVYQESGLAVRRAEGTTAGADWTSRSQLIVPKPGYGYQISGLMRGQGLAGSTSRLRLDFLGDVDQVLAWDRPLLEAKIELIESWARAQGVPLYLGEFGCIRHCFEDDQGGERWVEDMLDILEQRGTHFNYHAYHEYNFGIYHNGEGLPSDDSVNQALVELFQSRFVD